MDPETTRWDAEIKARVSQEDKLTIEGIAASEDLRSADIVRRAVRLYLKQWRHDRALQEELEPANA